MANRNRRHHDHAAARRHGLETGLRDAAILRHPTGPGGPDGHVIEDTEASANLVITAPWPGQIRTVYGDHQRVVDTYYATYKGFYFTGDGARRDADGYYRITGRTLRKTSTTNELPAPLVR